MKKTGIILVAHGDFAKAAYSSAEMIIGTQENVLAEALVPGEGLDDMYSKVLSMYESLDTEQGVVVICDIFGGTPSNAITKLLLEKTGDEIYAFTGLNLPILLETMLNQEMNAALLAKHIQSVAIESIQSLNERLLQNKIQTDNDAFEL